MKKFRFSQISDALFVFALAALAVYVPAAFYTRMKPAAAAIAIAAAAIAASVYLRRTIRKNGKAAIKKEDEETFAKCRIALILGSKSDGNAVVRSLLIKEGKEPKEQKGGFLTSDGNFVFAEFLLESLSADKAVAAYKKTPKGKNLAYIGISFSEECERLAESLSPRIKLVKLEEIFPLLKKHGVIPEGGFVAKKSKRKIADAIRSSFDRKKAGTFAVYGAAMLAMSYFAFFPVWYVLSGCFFIVYSLAILIYAKPKDNPVI